MTHQTAAPLTRLHLDAHNSSAASVSHYIDEGWLILDPPYQRGDVWTPAQRIGLIRSLLMGLPIPAVVFNDRTNNGWTDAHGGVRGDEGGQGFMAVVDGKQRITTLHTWFSGDLAVPASWFDPADITGDTENSDSAEGDGPYVRFTGLAEDFQRHMKYTCTIPTVTGKVATVEAEADLYLLLNGAGTPHSEADLMRATAYSSDPQA